MDAEPLNPQLAVEWLASVILEHWQARGEQGTACHFCTASVGRAATVMQLDHDEGCPVRAIIYARAFGLPLTR